MDNLDLVILAEKDASFAQKLNDFLASNCAVLEIGFGKGLFLLKAAMRFPEKKFFGIEKAMRHVKFSASRYAKRKMNNIKLVYGMAEKILSDNVKDGTFSEIYIFHPDPWPKKRHNKRRILSATTLSLFARKLKKEGYLLITTDAAEYYQLLLEEIDKVKELQYLKDPYRQYPATNFSIKYQRQKRKFYSLLAWPQGAKLDYNSIKDNFFFDQQEITNCEKN